jgi:hypothetical protein
MEERLVSHLLSPFDMALMRIAHSYVKAQVKLEDLRKGKRSGRERISRSQGQSEDCVVM